MAAFTLLHVAISLIAIFAGFVVLFGFLNNKEWSRWTDLFLMATVLTSVTGFGFPATHITPAHALGFLSLLVLGVAIISRFLHHLMGGWRLAYIVNSVVALYLNVFVLIVQMFQKAPALRAIAPTQSEWPFVAAQLVTLVTFAILGSMAARRFHPQAVPLTAMA